jgi:TetR/AcrR family transcriptional repressor of nem operon
MPRATSFDKQAILRAAMLVFWQKGYHDTSMQDLVDATRLNRSSIYNSFGDKLSLYQETLNVYVRETQAQFAVALGQSTSALHALHAVFEDCLPQRPAGTQGCMHLQCKATMYHEPGIKRWLEQSQEQTLHTFEQLITLGQEEGSINKNQTARDYALHVVNILEREPDALKVIVHNGLYILSASVYSEMIISTNDTLRE